MAWFLLLIAGSLEVVWAFALKQSDGLSRPLPAAVAGVTMLASVALLALAMRTLPLGTAYAVWTGIGAVGACIVGIVVLGDALTLPRVTAVALIVAGLALLKVSSPE